MNHHRSILLLEDDKVDAMTVSRALQELRISNPLVHVVNGVEALDYLSECKEDLPCIILLDLNMPKMGGLEFLTEMKKRDELRKIPVIILTTSSAERDINKSFNIGVAGYMVKPVDYFQFVDVIREIKMYWTISELPD